MKRIVILGGGESGAGAAVLAKKQGFEVFLSDLSEIKPQYKNLLNQHEIEWEEKQHTEEVKFFDKKQTVSGVGRGEQRKIYDQRRREVLPQHGIQLIELDYSDFEHTRGKKLVRNREEDLKVIIKNLKKILIRLLKTQDSIL